MTAYSAGTVFLQVLPVFQDLQNNIRKEVAGLDKALGDESEKAARTAGKRAGKAMGEEIGREVEKSAPEAARKAADDYAGHFRTQFKKGLADLNKELKAQKLSVIDDDQVKEDFARLRKEFKQFQKLKIGTDIDSSVAIAKAKAMMAALDAIVSNDHLEAEVRVNADAAKRNLESFLTGAEKRLARFHVEAEKALSLDVKADFKYADRQLGAFANQFRKTMKSAAKSIGDNAGEEIKKVRAELQSLGDTDIGIDLSVDSAMARAQLLQARLQQLEAESTDIDVRVDTLAASAELAALHKAVTALDGKDIDINADVDAGAAFAEIGALNSVVKKSGLNAQDGANAFRAFNGVLLGAVVLGPILIPILAALAGGLIALVPVALGVVAGLATMAIGFSGVIQAVQALSAAENAGAKDHQAYADAMRSATRSVADAERNLERAREDAAQAATDAARRVADAQRQASDLVQSALQQEADARQRVADATQSVQEAEENLRQAREDARQEQEDLTDQRRQNSLDERQAQIDLFNARVNLDATLADPGATSLEKEQARIDFQNAKLRLKNIRDEGEALKERKKEGVNGSEEVQTAQDQLTEAIQAQKDAIDALGEASKEVDQARLDAARLIADAIRDQNRATEDGARSVGDAQRNLTRAQEDYQSALKRTGELGSSAMRDVELAMGKLSPAGRRFARFLFGLRDGFLRVRRVIERGMLPGVQSGMEAIINKTGPGFLRFIRRMSRVLGNLFEEVGKEFANDPVFQEFFGMLSELGPRFMRQFGRMTLNWLKVFSRLMTLTAPLARTFSNALLRLSENAVKWATSKEGTETWQKFMAYVQKVGPEVWDFFKKLFKAVLQIAIALAPFGEVILKVVTKILDFIGTMDPEVLGPIVFGILALVTAFQLANGAIALVTLGFTAFRAVMIGSVVIPLGAIVIGVVLVIAALVLLYTKSEVARKIMDAIFHAIASAAEWLWNEVLVPAFEAIGKAFEVMIQFIADQWNKWGRSTFETIGRVIKGTWENVLRPVFKAIGFVVSSLWRNIWKPIFKLIWDYYVTVFKVLKWTWEHVLRPVFKVIFEVVGYLWSNVFKPVLKLIGEGFAKLGKGIKWVWENIIAPVFTFFRNALFGADGNGGLVGVFHTAIESIGSIWATLADLAKKPVKFVIETVINKGIIGGFNKISGFFHGPHIDDIPLPKGFARGGIPSARNMNVYPGYTPGRDVGYIGISGGEAIMRPEWTQAIGKQQIDAMNSAARRGGVQAVRSYLGGYKDGGITQIAWPTKWKDKRLTVPFGQKGSVWSLGYHTGQDFDGETGDDIFSILPGRVAQAGYNGSYGNSITLTHDIEGADGPFQTLYGHMSSLIAKLGDMVTAGAHIGEMGETGNAYGDHLHLELRPGVGSSYADAVDPMALFQIASALGDGDTFGGSVFGNIGGFVKGVAGGIVHAAKWVYDAVRDPKGFLMDRVLGDLDDKLFDNPFGAILKKIPGTMADFMVDKIKDLGSVLFASTGHLPERGYGSDSIESMLRSLALGQGWGLGDQWTALFNLVDAESGFNPNAQNPDSSAYGLFQFLDSTWAQYGKKTSDPSLQIKYGLQYIADRYGDPLHAWAFHQSHGWYKDGGVVDGEGDTGRTMMYDNGGYLPPGLTTVLNMTGKPEPVFTSSQWDMMRGSGSGGGTNDVDINLYGSDVTAGDVADELRFALRHIERGGVYQR